MVQLLICCTSGEPQVRWSAPRQEVNPDVTPEEVSTLSFAQLRDELLAKGSGPLDKAWVARVNAAEAEFWRRNSG
jgi:hypothetical protein